MYNSKKTAQQANGASASERAYDRFAEMMIEKIESISNNWQKPWFSNTTMFLPRNLSGRLYNGSNSLMLTFHCEKMNYKYPVFCTFDRVSGLNYIRTSEGIAPAVDEEGNKLPRVSVNKGEKSFPVHITTFTVVDKKGNKIKYEDYKKLSLNEMALYNVYPKLQVFNVFNIAQTNLAEARPKLYSKIIEEFEVPTQNTGDNFHFAPMDKIIAENLWYCPINLKQGDDAYYSISKKKIVMPKYEQFRDGESFYSNTFHEMAHSTGCEELLNRLEPAKFGSDDYAREELVAELTAALVSLHFGMQKHICEDSAAYIKSWLKSLKENPSFIKTVLADVKKASSMLISKIEEVQITLDSSHSEATFNEDKHAA